MMATTSGIAEIKENSQCLSTEKTSFSALRAYETQVTLTPIPSEKQWPSSCYWNIRILSSFCSCFHNIMPHVDLLYAQLQNRNIDSVHINGCIHKFQQDIQKIRDSLHSMVEQSSGSLPSKRRRTLSPEEHKRIAAEISWESCILGLNCILLQQHIRSQTNQVKDQDNNPTLPPLAANSLLLMLLSAQGHRGRLNFP